MVGKAMSFSSGDEESFKKFRAMIGPQQVDNFVREAIKFCWMSLPEDKKTVDEVEHQIRRIVERAIKDFRDDSEAFGLPLKG